MLAQRTQKLIEEIKPDTVLVQTSPQWWSHAQRLQYVESQEEMNNYNSFLDRHNNMQTFDFYHSQRRWMFLARLYIYNWLWRGHFMFGPDFRMEVPGLEVKFACESAEKVGANLQFLGPELDQNTWRRLFHETRFNLPDYLLRRFQRAGTFWGLETKANR